MKQAWDQPKLVEAPDYEELCAMVADKITALARQSVQASGRFSAALSGGNTPQGIYKLLGSAVYKNQINWDKLDLFLSDERWVPLVHPRSNFKMIAQALGPLSLCLHPVQTAALSPQISAQMYEQEIRNCFKPAPGGLPVFDLILLGLGEDGHTASLFPNNPGLKEDKQMVIAVEADGIEEPRISMTLPLINNARCVIFVVSGKKKTGILRTVMSAPAGGSLPAQMVCPSYGDLWWFADQDAGKGQ